MMNRSSCIGYAPSGTCQEPHPVQPLIGQHVARFRYPTEIAFSDETCEHDIEQCALVGSEYIHHHLQVDVAQRKHMSLQRAERDEVVHQVAREILDAKRPGGSMCRWGGGADIGFRHAAVWRCRLRKSVR